MNFITRFSNRIAGCGALFISTFLATVPCPAQDFANKERAIRAHVNQRDLRGELPAPVLEELRRRGEELFTARFTPADGVGRPLAARSTVPTSRAARPENSLIARAGRMSIHARIATINLSRAERAILQPAFSSPGRRKTNGPRCRVRRLRTGGARRTFSAPA